MDLRYVVILILLSIASQCFAQTDKEERHIHVSMRMIGHEILLNSGDSISRVLPIEKDADRYKISFDVDFQFDPEEMVSVIDRVVQEADLLFLLHTFANDTVEREIILKNVWGDDGDYVGRTLDVFISKLRKKLEADSSIRIVNIRGVGYKLVLNQ